MPVPDHAIILCWDIQTIMAMSTAGTARRSKICQPDLLDFPQHLKEVLLSKLEALEGPKSTAVMRLVSKSWQAAYKGFSASLKVQAESFGQRRLQTSCRISPNMRALEIVNAQKGLDLATIASLTALTSIRLEHHKSTDPLLDEPDDSTESLPNELEYDLSLLPTSLQNLALHGIAICPGPIVMFTCLFSQSLICTWRVHWTMPGTCC